MNYDAKRLGSAISRIRKNRDLTQEQVAERIGVTQNFISMLETGAREASIGTLAKLADEFEIPLPALVTLGWDPETSRVGKLTAKLQNLVIATAGLEVDSE